PLYRQTAQPIEESVVDPTREHDWIARVEAQTAYMRQGKELIRELSQATIAQAEGVAAAQDHLGDGRIGGDRGDGLGPSGVQRRLIRIGEVAPEAMTAVNCAGGGCDDERSALVFVQHAWSSAACQIADRVRGIAVDDLLLREGGKHLQKQRILRIALAHLRDERARYAQWKIARTRERGRNERRVELEQLAELLRIGDRVRKLLLPRWRVRL